MEKAVQERRIVDYNMLLDNAYQEEEKQHLKLWYHKIYVPVENASLEEWYGYVEEFRGIGRLTSP